jgi:hypothetical protein
MYDGDGPEMWSQFCQATMKSVRSITGLLEWRATDCFWIPALTVEGNVLVGLDLGAKDTSVGDDDNEIDLSAQTMIPGGKVERMQHNPFIRSGREQVEDIALARGRPLVHKRGNQSRH